MSVNGVNYLKKHWTMGHGNVKVYKPLSILYVVIWRQFYRAVDVPVYGQLEIHTNFITTRL